MQPVWSVTPNSYLIPKFAEHSTSSSLSPLHLVAPHCSNSSLAVAPRSPPPVLAVASRSPPPVLAVAPRCALLLQYSPSRRTPLLQSSPSSLSPLLVAGFASDNFSPLLFAVAPQTSEFLHKSTIKSLNRRSRPALHTGGSISHKEHTRRLTVKLKRPPSAHEIHVHLHTKKHDGVTFVDERAQQVSDRYHLVLQERLTEPGSQPTPEDERLAYLEAAGGVRPGGRVYGIGSQAAITYEDEIRMPRIDPRAELRHENKELRQEVQTLRNENQEFQQRLGVLEEFMARMAASSISSMSLTPSGPSAQVASTPPAH